MKEVTTSKGQWLFVEITKEARNIAVQIGFDEEPDQHLMYYDFSIGGWHTPIYLPEGFWKFIATSKDITEEQSLGVVDIGYSLGDSHKFPGEYYKDYLENSYEFDTATESIHSLMTSQGLSLEKNYAILQKQPILNPH